MAKLEVWAFQIWKTACPKNKGMKENEISADIGEKSEKKEKKEKILETWSKIETPFIICKEVDFFSLEIF